MTCARWGEADTKTLQLYALYAGSAVA